MSQPVPEPATAFARVDIQPDPAGMVAAMDATAQWPAVRQLREWERQRLALKPGDRLLDLGCGAGDVAIQLAADVLPGGAVVGLDASEAMLAAGRQRAADTGVQVEFRQGDALALDDPDGSFDAARAERALQWIPGVDGAIAELIRVLRPGGRLSLIDTDWRTLTIDLPDVALADAVLRAIFAFRGPSVAVGGRLLNLCRDAGLRDIEGTCATHVWSEWDPDSQPAPSGMIPVRPLIERLVANDVLDAAMGERFLEQVLDAARRDRFYMSLTMVAVIGTRGAG
ncbi:MAG: methyltransferase domain-containing protein [Actinomycetota bacterium]|nr:methyltransferase domain-containing protein [Actinomycetota bacterium]